MAQDDSLRPALYLSDCPDIMIDRRWDIPAFQASRLGQRLRPGAVIPDDAIESPCTQRIGGTSPGIFLERHSQDRPISAVHSIGMRSRNRPFKPLVQFPFSHVRPANSGKSNREQISGKRNPEETRSACINGVVLFDLPNWESCIGACLSASSG